MGYYVDIMDVDFLIPVSELDDSYKTLCDLNNDNSKKSGGSLSHKDQNNTSGPNPNVWFAWMHWNYPETCKNTQEILVELGFDTELDNHGLHVYGYSSKSGSEEVFLNALAPYVVNGSYITWQGEDSYQWRNMFIDGKMHTYELKSVVFGDFTSMWMSHSDSILKPIGYLASDIIKSTLERISSYEKKEGNQKLDDLFILRELVWLVRRIGYPKIWDNLNKDDIELLVDKFIDYVTLYQEMADDDSETVKKKIELGSEVKNCKSILKRWEDPR